MSKKSKKRAALEAQQNLEGLDPIYQTAPEQPAASQQLYKRPKISFKVMNNCAPVPVARPSDFIQLTPIVQPIPIVPYSTQAQPIAMFEDDEE